MAHGFTEEWLAQRQQRKEVSPAPLNRRSTPGGVTHPPTNTSRSKHRNRKTLITFADSEIVGGHLRLCHEFASQKEADYYAELVLRRQTGQITALRLQEPYALLAYGQRGQKVHCGEYWADFIFFEVLDDGSSVQRVVDVKGQKLDTYILKKKIVEACYGIAIQEV